METRIVLGNGQRLKDVCIGDKRRIMIQENGARVPILMKNVKYVPQLYCILFSISAALKEGCKAKNERSELMTVHRMLVQPSENITRSTCLKFGKHCEGCSLGKTKQKNINKKNSSQSEASWRKNVYGYKFYQAQERRRSKILGSVYGWL